MGESSGGQQLPDVDVRSPDRSVRIAVTLNGDIGVELANLHQHNEQSLARQVAAAARVALAATQQARSRGSDAKPAARWIGWPTA
jgi:hypothetical protein